MLLRVAFIGVFLVLLLGTVGSHTLAAAGSFHPTLSLPRISFGHFGGHQGNAPHSTLPSLRWVSRGPTIAPLLTLTQSWFGTAHSVPGAVVDVRLTIDNPAANPVRAWIYTALTNSLVLDAGVASAQGTVPRASISLQPGRNIVVRKVTVPTNASPGPYYLATDIQLDAAGPDSNLIDAGSVLTVGR